MQGKGFSVAVVYRKSRTPRPKIYGAIQAVAAMVMDKAGDWKSQTLIITTASDDGDRVVCRVEARRIA